MKQSLKLKSEEVKKIEAKMSMTGKSNSLTHCDSSLQLENTPSKRATQEKIAIQVMA
jgi:hypothetical protein